MKSLFRNIGYAKRNGMFEDAQNAQIHIRPTHAQNPDFASTMMFKECYAW